MIVDKACWERGCACHDDRVDGEGVEVVKKEWTDLTDEEVWKVYGLTGLGNGMALRFARTVLAIFKEKNT